MRLGVGERRLRHERPQAGVLGLRFEERALLLGDGEVGAQALQSIAHVDQPALEQGPGHGCESLRRESWCGSVLLCPPANRPRMRSSRRNTTPSGHRCAVSSTPRSDRSSTSGKPPGASPTSCSGGAANSASSVCTIRRSGAVATATSPRASCSSRNWRARVRLRSRWRSPCNPTWRRPRSRTSAPTRSASAGCARRSRARRSVRSRSPNPTRAPTSPRFARAPSETATSGASRARRCSSPTARARTSSRWSRRRTPARAIAASACSSSTRRCPASRCRATSRSWGCGAATPPRSRSTTSPCRTTN